MAFKIVWSAEAKKSYFQIIDYLILEWTTKEVSNFITQVDKKLTLLVQQPRIGLLHKKKYRIHKKLVHKYVSLVYCLKPRKKEIILLTFWDNRKMLKR